MAQSTVDIHSGRPGDVIVVSGHRVGDPERLGKILEILGEEAHIHYRVRWDNGNETIFSPGNDATIRRAHTRAPRKTT